MTVRRFSINLASVVVGAAIGAIGVLAVGGLTNRPSAPPRPAMLVAPPQQPSSVRTTAPGVLLAWATGGLPSSTEATLESMRGVKDATTVVAGLDWLRTSRLPDGGALDAPPGGRAIPMESALVQPREYATFVPAADRELILALRPGEAVIAQTESELRGAGEGLQMNLSGRSLRVSGVVSDAATNGYEDLVAGSIPRSWARADRFVLVHVSGSGTRGRIERRLRSLLAPGQVLRIRAQGETPFLRYGDAVLPQMLIKETFGEFAARPLTDGRIDIDPRWRRRHIQTARVPIVGSVTCNRVLIPQLRAALREVQADGLSYLVHPAEFGGCYSPRFIDSNPGGRLSHHSWGIAVDLNVAENPFGTKPHQDQRLVEVMKGQGFTWGGRWQIPDGMHFEWVRFP